MAEGNDNHRAPESDAERRLRNLQAVARHRASGGGSAQKQANKHEANEALSPWKKRLAALGPVGVAILFILGKLKFLIPLLKVSKLGTMLSMLLAVWAYTLFWGLPFAVGFVLLIFVHEMGHALMMRAQGVKAGAPVFIPFVGAVIAMKSLPRNAWVEALIGIGGPVLGGIGALVCLLVGWSTGSLFWYALASTGFLINLFNMIPISPLDGGRIVGVISRWIWVAGYAIGIALFLVTYSPILFLILLLGLMGLTRAIRGRKEDYYEVSADKRLLMGIAYFGTLALLVLGMWLAEQPLEEFHGGLQGAVPTTGSGQAGLSSLGLAATLSEPDSHQYFSEKQASFVVQRAVGGVIAWSHRETVARPCRGGSLPRTGGRGGRRGNRMCLSGHGVIQNVFSPGRHHLLAENFRLLRDRSFETWNDATNAGSNSSHWLGAVGALFCSR